MLNVKNVPKKDCSRVKSLMQQVQRFKEELGEADKAIIKQSDLIQLNKASSTPGVYKLWSFKTNPSFSKNTPGSESEAEDQINDTGALSNDEQVDYEHTPSQLPNNSSTFKVGDINGGSEIDITTRERFLNKSNEKSEFGDGGANTPSMIEICVLSDGEKSEFSSSFREM